MFNIKLSVKCLVMFAQATRCLSNLIWNISLIKTAKCEKKLYIYKSSHRLFLFSIAPKNKFMTTNRRNNGVLEIFVISHLIVHFISSLWGKLNLNKYFITANVWNSTKLIFRTKWKSLCTTSLCVRTVNNSLLINFGLEWDKLEIMWI